MELEFVKVNAAGNVTVIVLDPVPPHVYGEVARQLMCPQGLGAEQVGFAERSEDPVAVARLHMMGGEFCGNASRAFAAWLAFRGYPGVRWQGEEAEVPLQVSGHTGVVLARVRCGPGGRPVWASCSMPVPRRIAFLPFRGRELALIEFPGICHAVVWGMEPAVEAFREVAAACGDLDAPAFGVMFFQEDKAELVPLVAVRKSGSLVWEGSCASGTVAVASALAAREGRSLKDVELKQPHGRLWVRVDWEGKISAAEVAGPVQIVAQGTAWVTQ